MCLDTCSTTCHLCILTEVDVELSNLTRRPLSLSGKGKLPAEEHPRMGVETSSQRLLGTLQFQNAAAHLITGARRRDHISPDLWQLHWLPVRQ